MSAFGSNLKARLPKEKISSGLDIGTQSVKLVKLYKDKDKAELLGAGIELIKRGLFDQAVKKILDSHRDVKRVNISLCGPATIIRYVNFPKMSAVELKQALKFEVQKHIPFSVAEVNLDGHILRDDLPDNKMVVMVAAVKKEFVNERLKILKDLGLEINAINVDSVALINGFNFNYSQDSGLKNKTIALLNIGATESSLNILEDGMPRLSRDIHIAGNSFTRKIQDTLSIDADAAEQMKINPPAEKLESLNSIIETALSSLSGELRSSFDYYESQSVTSVEKILLSGGSSMLGGLKGILSNLMGIAVEQWDPMKQLTLSDNVEAAKVRPISAQLAVAIGQALGAYS